jgi:predicted nucleic acid-binding protein
MPVKVIDASALAALLFGEPDAERIAEELRDCSLVAPVLLPFEIASVCLEKIRRHPSQRTNLLAAFAMLARLAVAQSAVDVGEVLQLSERARLTVYDAAYLWLARRLGAELVTLDKRLATAAARR